MRVRNESGVEFDTDFSELLDRAYDPAGYDNRLDLIEGTLTRIINCLTAKQRRAVLDPLLQAAHLEAA